MYTVLLSWNSSPLGAHEHTLDNKRPRRAETDLFVTIWMACLSVDKLIIIREQLEDGEFGVRENDKRKRIYCSR